MKIALFLIRNIMACHYAIGGYYDTLRRMGHEVDAFEFPSNTVDPAAVEREARFMPTIEQLNTYDVILSTYHEYVQPWLKAIYKESEWVHTSPAGRDRLKVPVIARYDESMDRGDLLLPARMPELKKWAQYHFFPAAQDAEKFGGEWLTFGADTNIFYPDEKVKRPYPVVFIGSMYPIRQKYIEGLVQHLGRGVEFRVGRVFVQDLSGTRERDSTLLLAENYRQCQIFFCLPPMSHLIVEKVFEIMACDTLVMYPRLVGAAAKNLSLFEDNKHIVYYEDGFMPHNGKQVRFYLQHPEERERIARAGGELVRSQYTLRQMLSKMLAILKKEKTNETVPSIASATAT